MTNFVQRVLLVPALALTMLSACASSSVLKHQSENKPRVSLAAVPGDIRVCFKQLTGVPMPGSMTTEQITFFITELRTSEVAKTQCGQRLLRLYDQQSGGVR